MKKLAYILVVLIAVICTAFFLKNKMPNSIKEGKTYISSDLRPVLSISLNPKKNNIVYAGCGLYYGENNTVFKSTNYGESFLKLRKGLIVAVNPISPDTVFVGTLKNGLFRSVDSGKSWNETELRNVKIRDIKISNKTGTVYVITDRGFFVSEDNGVNFKHINLGKDLRQYYVFLGSEKDCAIYISAQLSKPVGNPPYYGEGNVLLKSSDNGKSWKEIDEGLKQHLVTALAVSPEDKNTILVGTSIAYGGPGNPHKETGIFKSTDGGLHWKNVGLYDFINSLYVDPINANVVYAGTDKGLLESADFGETWKAVKLSDKENPIYSIAINRSSRIIYLGTKGAIYRIKERE